jgi:glyceraldehyde-3-phosphate dehydrogenase/erythrose-4-phosphate dehydrogenase
MKNSGEDIYLQSKCFNSSNCEFIKGEYNISNSSCHETCLYVILPVIAENFLFTGFFFTNFI